MLALGVLLSILVSTIALIVFLDFIQGNSTYEAWYNLKDLLKVAKGEDYFLIIVFMVVLLLLFLTHIRGKK